MRPNRTEIKKMIAAHIARGGIILADKTKAAYYGGLHHVSAGPYRAAIPNAHRYALITTGRRSEAHSEAHYQAAWQAASDFVDFVGNQIAYDALIAARRRNA